MALLQTRHALHIAPADFRSVERWFSLRQRTEAVTVRERAWVSAGESMAGSEGSQSSLHRPEVGGGADRKYARFWSKISAPPT